MVKKVKFKRSNKNTGISSLEAGEMALHLGDTNGSVMLFLGNLNNMPILINNPSFRFYLNQAFTECHAIESGKSYNLISSLVAEDILGAEVTNFDYISKHFSYNEGNSSLIFPPFKYYTDYRIRVQLQGTISGSAGTDRQFNIELRRGADNSLVLQDYVIEIDGNDLTGLTRFYTTFVNGLNDPYITGGLQIVLNNTSGATINLTGFNLLIQGIGTNFIQ